MCVFFLLDPYRQSTDRKSIRKSKARKFHTTNVRQFEVTKEKFDKQNPILDICQRTFLVLICLRFGFTIFRFENKFVYEKKTEIISTENRLRKTDVDLRTSQCCLLNVLSGCDFLERLPEHL